MGLSAARRACRPVAALLLLRFAVAIETLSCTTGGLFSSSAPEGQLLGGGFALQETASGSLDCQWTLGSAGAVTQIHDLVADTSWFADSFAVFGARDKKKMLSLFYKFRSNVHLTIF